MQDLISVVKIFGLSLLVVLLMQLKVANNTLENHFEGWVQNSTVVTYLQGAADGACKLAREGSSAVTEYTHDKFHIPEKWKPNSKAAATRHLRSARASAHASVRDTATSAVTSPDAIDDESDEERD